MRFEEAVAKLIVETLIAGAVMRYCVRQDHRECDFELTPPNGGVVPFEVTTAADRTLNQTLAAIRAHSKGGPFVQRTVAKNDWYVHPLPSADIRKVRRNVDGYLAKIELEGRTTFFADTDAAESPAVWAIFRDLRIDAGDVLALRPPGRILIALPGQGCDVSSTYVQEAIQHEASKADNRRKLLAAGGPERHLFVYVDPNRYPAWVGLVDERPPTVAPQLPEEVTHVWAVTTLEDHDNLSCGARTQGRDGATRAPLT
ncbi:MAG: hypothetical protein ABR606_02295 [Vicinamibacterales bacterium]